jgi:hypothetical protein
MYKLHIVRIQEVWWEREGYQIANNYIFLMEIGISITK